MSYIFFGLSLLLLTTDLFLQTKIKKELKVMNKKFYKGKLIDIPKE